jgi:high-affinity Fe2+/Pb2+ permease
MLCCLTGAVIAGNAAVAGGFAFGARRRYLLAGGILGLAVAGLASAPVLVEHAGHYADRADANGRSVLAEILVAPLCSGGTT